MHHTIPGLALASILLAGCGGEGPSAVAPLAQAKPMATAEPAASTRVAATIAIAPLAALADPTTFASSAKGMTDLCDSGIKRAENVAAEVRALRGKPAAELTWQNTLGHLDEMYLALRTSGDFSELMAESHPDKAVRDAAKACEPKIEHFDTNFLLDEGIAEVVKAYAAKKEPLEAVRARLLAFVLRDFRRNGLELPKEGQAELRKENEELTKLTQEFQTNLSSSTLSVSATAKDLEGLPASYIDGHKPDAQGKITITTDYPDYFPVAQYAKNRAFALELYKQFDNRAADKNVALLDKILVLRAKKAKLLGYKTWADYMLEPRMAKDPKTVASFLSDLRSHVAKKSAEELREFRAMKKKLGQDPNGPMLLSDRTYLEDQVRQAKYGLDSKRVSEYLEVESVKQGLLTVTGRLFGVKYRALPNFATWHPDVTAYEVQRESGEVLGRFYFDLHPREGKYKHAAVFGIRDARTMADGSRLMPIAAIVCNFPKTTAAAPGLMSHQDVTTFFHEFGHVLHHLFSQAEFTRFSGTSVERDFVEAPSQMLEEWAWNKEVLALFAKHHKTGEVLPNDLYSAMARSRSFGRGLTTSRQLFLAALDQSYHTREPGFESKGFDSTAVVKEVQTMYTPFSYVEGTHFQATFGHLMGYDAGYYGYQWALSIAQDMFASFKKAGIFDPKVAQAYRSQVLEQGGTNDANAMLTKFLGRAPDTRAYKAFLLEGGGK
jgi:thimet oligopeptidase